MFRSLLKIFKMLPILKKFSFYIIIGLCIIAIIDESKHVIAEDVVEAIPPASETPSVIMPKEIATGKNIDVTQHKNVHLLPTEQDCGFADKEETTPKTGGIKLFFKPNIPSKYPWLVRVVNEDGKGVRSPVCAGSLINSRYVLTSATCLTGYSKVVSVILGGQGSACDSGKCIPISKVIDVAETITHPDYVFPTRQHDIGLIKLAKDVVPESYMRPVCLPLVETIYSNFKNNKTTVIGWPKLEDGSLASYMLYPRNLRVTEMNFESREYCDRFYKRSHAKFGAGRFCASSSDTNKGICPNDDGGPLLKSLTIPETELVRTFQIGVVSFHHKLCGQPGIPGGFTNVINYMPWILDSISLD